MKKNYFYFIAVVLILTAIFTSCNDDHENEEKESSIAVTGVALDQSTATLIVGEELTLNADVIPEDATNKTVTWKSSNPEVAIVATGKVTALAPGTTTITVSTKDGDKKATSTLTVNAYPVEPEMIFVEGGIFTMGCNEGEGSDCNSIETPAQQITLSNFYISKYEITQGQWKAVMGENPSFRRGDNYPVEMVTWNDVNTFIVRLNEKTGKKYRMLTEAEWEYAAKGGNKSKGYKYSGSNDANDVAWQNGNCLRSQPVGTKQPNELGIYDMSGNVSEWCSDWYGSYTSLPKTNPTGPSDNHLYRVTRGGSWISFVRACRTLNRGPLMPNDLGNAVGFRLAHPSE